VAEICRKAGISQATYFNWKKRYAGLMPSEMRWLRELKDDNNRLKKIVADLTLDQVTPRRSFRHLFGESVRLSCRFVSGGQGPLSGAFA
jgi:hypothetical protein